MKSAPRSSFKTAARHAIVVEARARNERAIEVRRVAETHPGRPLTAPRTVAVPLRGPAPGVHGNPQAGFHAPAPGPAASGKWGAGYGRRC